MVLDWALWTGLGGEQRRGLVRNWPFAFFSGAAGKQYWGLVLGSSCSAVCKPLFIHSSQWIRQRSVAPAILVYKLSSREVL